MYMRYFINRKLLLLVVVFYKKGLVVERISSFRNLLRFKVFLGFFLVIFLVIVFFWYSNVYEKENNWSFLNVVIVVFFIGVIDW